MNGVTPRRKTRQVRYGTVAVGGDAPISIQSMSTFRPVHLEKLFDEVTALADAGCEIVRVAVKDRDDIDVLPPICDRSPIPVIADIQFDYELAVAAAGAGVAGLRINPGNIGAGERVARVLESASKSGIAVRVGVNSGSIERDLRELYKQDPGRALFESASRSLEEIEVLGFTNLVFSLKSSDPIATVEANRLFAASCDYPLHIGVTEAGPALSGAARSSVALTLLLSMGIGDTVRVSLSGDPVREVIVAANILSALGLRGDIPRIISCPTCGRSWIDVAGIAEQLERKLMGIRSPISIAVMGCEVNGPGEARDADIGIAGTRGGAVIFRNGKVIGKCSKNCIEKLLGEIGGMVGKKDDCK